MPRTQDTEKIEKKENNKSKEHKETKEHQGRKGKIFMAVGLLLIVAALLLTLYNLREEQCAGEEAEAVLEQLQAEIPETEAAPEYALDPKMEMPTVTIDGNEYIGILTIPSLDIELPVMEQWGEARSKIAPCRYQGSVYADDMIIAGHNYRTHFGHLSSITSGDTVLFTDVNGSRYTYTVTESERISGTDIAEMQAGDDWDLTLFTCTIGGRERYTVRCTRVGR